MSDNTLLYKVKDLRHGYNNRFMLNIPELGIDSGVSIGFIGPNGSGKSTLFRILAFLEAPFEGSIYFNGEKVINDNISFRNDVTLLLQESYLLKRSVFENVAYGLRVRGEKRNLKERVFEALQWVGLSPEEFAGRRWFELSGGEAQRVALASRLVLRPRVLILDEPTSNIDQLSASLIKEAITTIRKRYNTSLIISSHDHVWLNRVADDVLRIHDGRIVGSGAENIIEGPWHADEDDLWSKVLTDGEKIFATKPIDSDSIALLNPSEIIISDVKQSRMSAQNILNGKIASMSTAKDSGKIKVDVEMHGILLTCNLTQHAVHELKLIPGKDVWVIFKASSLSWQ